MAYQTYTTEAIVCGSFAEREHDRTLRLFTKEGGMLYARAGGTRAHVSKLRYALQDFSYARVTLVRGKAEWRVVGAVSFDNFYFKARARSARANILASMRSLCRFVQGASIPSELFSLVLDGMYSLSSEEEVVAERLFLLRLLHQLGYVSPEGSYLPLLEASTLKEARAFSETEPSTLRLIEKTIENALTLSHL